MRSRRALQAKHGVVRLGYIVPRRARAQRILCISEQRSFAFWRTMNRMRSIVLLAALVLTSPLLVRASTDDMEPALQAAHEMFYNGRYADAAAETAKLCAPDRISDLRACELRTSALHFMLRRAMGESADRKQAFARCADCEDLLATFVAETRRGADAARTRLKTTPGDEDALFLLGKLDLNYVWLQLATMGRRTGWDEYWEARHSLDAVLKANPRNVRAKVARGWVDYIVDTKMPGGTRWLLGGGNKKRGLQAIREAAEAGGTTFVRAEADFALWDMQVREKDIAGARMTATSLARDFPENPDLRKFLDAQPTSLFRLTGK